MEVRASNRVWPCDGAGNVVVVASWGEAGRQVKERHAVGTHHSSIDGRSAVGHGAGNLKRADRGNEKEQSFLVFHVTFASVTS
jgi:hypothetical protein